MWKYVEESMIAFFERLVSLTGERFAMRMIIWQSRELWRQFEVIHSNLIKRPHKRFEIALE